MRIFGSLYVSFDTVKSDFLSAKARLPESPVLTNTFTKLPRLGGIFQPLYTFFSPFGCIEGLCFVSFLLIYLVNGGLTQRGERSGSIWMCSPLKPMAFWLSTRSKCDGEPWTGARSAWRSPSTAFWALRTETGARKTLVLRLREPARRNRPRNLQWIATNRWIRWTLDRTAASVHTVERFCTRPPVRPALFPDYYLKGFFLDLLLKRSDLWGKTLWAHVCFSKMSR